MAFTPLFATESAMHEKKNDATRVKIAKDNFPNRTNHLSDAQDVHSVRKRAKGRRTLVRIYKMTKKK